MFGFLKSRARHATIHSKQTVENITVEAGEDLLSAGLRAGLKWDHDCRQGDCAKCRCILQKGKIKRRTDFARSLTPQQLQEGNILACQSLLKSDVEIKVTLNEDDVRVPPKDWHGEIIKITPLTYDIKEVVIKVSSPLPEGTLAGQYAEVSYAGLDRPRSYSFARAPAREEEGCMRFFIRQVPGGTFTSWLFESDRTGHEVKVTAPFGDFYRRDNEKTMLCFAGGSGMSALKALLEDAADAQVPRDVIYLFGAREQKDLYCADDMARLKDTWHKGHTFQFTEVLSNELENSDWQGPRGYIIPYLQDSMLNPGKLDIRQCDVYMCGPPPMIDSIIEGLTAAGMEESNIYYDKFLDASNL